MRFGPIDKIVFPVVNKREVRAIGSNAMESAFPPFWAGFVRFTAALRRGIERILARRLGFYPQ